MPDYGDPTALPALPSVGANNIEDILARMKEVLEVWRGDRGDGLDKVVTIRDLLNAGTVDVTTVTNFIAPNATLPPPAAPHESAIPPTPTDLRASGAMTSIILEWTFPLEYTRLSHFELWRSATNAIGDAVIIAQPGEFVYTDEVGPNETFYYWVRAVSDAGLSPFNALLGTQGSTAIDVGAALDALQGQISESELTAALGARINLIDGPTSLTGSVNKRILDETNARTAALAAEASARGTAITNEATLRQAGDDALALQVSLITAGVAGGFDYGKVWYFDSGAEGWTSSGATQSTPTPGWVDVDSSGSDPAFVSPAISIAGGTYPVIKARIKRLAGAEASWDGTAYYTTSGHGFSSSHSKTISVPSPFGVGDTAIVEFAMDSLTAGGTDWITSTITGIRLDFGADATDTISVDWIAIGRNAPGASVAGLLTEQQARIDGDAAEAAARTTLAAQVDTNTADILTEQTARADADAALASDITALEAEVDANAAAITSEATTRASADSSLSSQITSVSAVANAKNKTYRQAAAPASGMTAGDIWFDSDDNNKAYRFDGAAWVATDDARIAANAAAIVTEQTARADADTALSSQITSVSAVANAKNKTYRQATAPVGSLVAGDVWYDSDDNNKAYRYDGAAWVATDDARIAANAAAIVTEQTARADADTALSSQITSVSAVANAKNKVFSQGTAPTSGMVTNDLWLDTANGHQLHRYDGAAWVAADDARITQNAAAITTEQTARADGDSALASEIDTLSATVNGNTAAIGQEAQVRADETGYLGALYTLRLDIGGVVGGYGVSGTNSGEAGPTIDFGIRANKFYVMPPQGLGDSGQSAFVYQATPTTVNGVIRMPGLYVNDIFVGNGVINNAKIGLLAVQTANIDDLAVTNAKVANMSAAKLITGSVGVSEQISSTGYTPGSSGWSISGNGVAEMNNLTLRGGIYASYGQISGITIYSDALATSNWNGSMGPSSVGWAIYANGSAYFNSISVRGDFNAGAMTGYAWPAAGSYGAHLSASGLLIGNANNNKYFQVDSFGNVFAPQFSINNGVATFSGALSAASGTFSGSLSGASGTFAGSLTAQVVNTANIVGAAVTVTSTASGSSSASLSVTAPSGSSALTIFVFPGISKASDGEGGTSYESDWATLVVNGTTVHASPGLRGMFMLVLNGPFGTYNISSTRSQFHPTSHEPLQISAHLTKR